MIAKNRHLFRCDGSDAKCSLALTCFEKMAHVKFEYVKVARFSVNNDSLVYFSCKCIVVKMTKIIAHRQGYYHFEVLD